MPSSLFSLCPPCRLSESRPSTLDLRTAQLLSTRESPQPRLSRQIRGGSPRTPRRGRVGILRTTGTSPDTPGVCRLAPPAVPLRLGGLFQAALRRSRTRVALSRLLHAPGGDFQPPPGLTRRKPCHLPLAGLRPPEQEAIDEPAGRGIRAPLSSPRAASGIRAYPALRILCASASRHSIAAVFPTSRYRRPSAVIRRITVDIRDYGATLDLPTMRWPRGPHRATHSHSGSAPFSSNGNTIMSLIRSFSSRTFRALRRHYQSCVQRSQLSLKGRPTVSLTPRDAPHIPNTTLLHAASLALRPDGSLSKIHSGRVPNRFLQVAISKTLRRAAFALFPKLTAPERSRYSSKTSRPLMAKKALTTGTRQR